MPGISIVLDGDGAWPDLVEKLNDGRATWLRGEEGKIAICGLAAGMSSGAPSVAIRVDLPDGRTVVAETSLRLLLTAADALKARHGDPREPARPVPPGRRN